MRLLAQDAKYLRAAFLHDLPFLLDHRSIDPVFGITDQLAAGFGSSKDSRTTGCSLREHQGLRGRTGAIKSSERLFNDDVLTQAKRLDRKFLVGGGRSAEIHHVHRIAKLSKRLERARTGVPGK